MTTVISRRRKRSVVEWGEHQVNLLTISCSSSSSSPAVAAPPKPLLVATPVVVEGGVHVFPVLLFLHGYLLHNEFYSQLLRHVASHGFIVVAPQLYSVAGPDATGDIRSAAATINWLPDGLQRYLPTGVRLDFAKLAVSGHSRGGKAAFGLALGISATADAKISALVGIDPVDGMENGNQTHPPILTGVQNSFNLNMPVMVIGCALSELQKNTLFPPCAPIGVNHRNFFDECRSPTCYFLARDYGHMDMLDDETKGLRGKLSYCLCKSGGGREPMRWFVGGAMVAFLRAQLLGDDEDLESMKSDPGTSPVALSEVSFR